MRRGIFRPHRGRGLVWSISFLLQLCAYRLSFPRHNDLLVEDMRFFLSFYAPQSRLKPSQGLFLCKMCTQCVKWCEMCTQKKRDLLAARRWKLHDPTVISFESISACDGRTDGHVICIANVRQKSINNVKISCNTTSTLT